VEDGGPGEVLKAGCGQVVTSTDMADGWVGKEARDDGPQGCGKCCLPGRVPGQACNGGQAGWGALLASVSSA